MTQYEAPSLQSSCTGAVWGNSGLLKDKEMVVAEEEK